MIKTLIIEDEKPAADRLGKMLVETGLDIKIIDILDSVESSVEWFKSNTHPDLVMLDIQLADGISFDIFKKVNVESFVIFTTAYDEYAIKSFELNSIDYLLKPIDKDRLIQSIEKFKRLSNKRPDFDIEDLINSIENKKTHFKKRFVVNVGVKIISIQVSEISYFISLEKNTFLVTQSGNSYAVDFSLDKLESLLDPEQFFRLNRQIVINYNSIQKINLLSKSRIEVKMKGSNDGFIVSKTKSHAFRLWLED